MPGPTFKVRFKATPAMQKHEHRRGGRRPSKYGKKDTTRLVAGDFMRDGDIREMDKFDKDWLLANYPQSFEVVEDYAAEEEASPMLLDEEE